MISVVIPAYNEQDAIGRTIAEMQTLLATGNFGGGEVVVVDDGSTDGTVNAAQNSGARVVRHPHNLGYGRALKSGIEAATHDTIAIVDADGTYPVADIPRLVETFNTGFDMVVGARSGASLRESALKSVLRRILTFLVQFTVGRKVPDVNSGLRVFSRRTVLPYFSHLCDTFSFTTSLTLAYMMTGRFVGYVPISYVERVGHTKVRLFRDALRTLQYIVQGIAYYNPIKIFLMLALAAIALAIIAAILIVPAGSPATAILIVVFGILTAILLFGLGLLADVLRQIMHK